MKAAFAVLDAFLAERLASPLGPDQKQTTRIGVDHLRRAMEESGLSLVDFVEKDGLAPYLNRLAAGVSPKYVEQLKVIWRLAFRYLCGRKLLAMDYGRCVVPSEQKDPYDLETHEHGFPEAWTGIYPACIMPPKAARSIGVNASVPEQIKKEFRLLVENLPERHRDTTSAGYWFVFRQLAVDLKIRSLKELANEEGARRLMAYFLDKQYARYCGSIRKLQSVFLNMAALGLMDNPFRLKARVGEVLKWVIDFSRLPEESPRQKFVTREGRRHTMVEGEWVECRLPQREVMKVAAFGNPALKGWRARPPEEFGAVFREAQENLIARTVLFYPARPLEVAASNWRDWRPLEGSQHGDYMLRNNAGAHKRKKRPDRVVPTAYIRELESLWELRRAWFAGRGDVDQKESKAPSMKSRGIAMFVHPRTGERLSALCLRNAIRAGLTRMGVPPALAAKATIYWERKAHQTLGRNNSGGVGDKHLAEQAGHSEVTMRNKYDGPDAVVRADFLRKAIWDPLGTGEAQVKGRLALPGKPVGDGAAPAQHVPPGDLVRYSAALASTLGPAGVQGGMSQAEFREAMHRAALQAGLLVGFDEAAASLDVDVRTIERWEKDDIVQAIRLDNRRYLLRAQVHELSQCLSAEEAGKLLDLTGRQVRNLIEEGKLRGAIQVGKNWKLPWVGVRELMNRRI